MKITQGKIATVQSGEVENSVEKVKL
jgi:hypothetical protein